MSRHETQELLTQIKVFFPRFEGVSKTGDEFEVSQSVVNEWYKRLGWMELKEAEEILNRYMRSENGSKTPNINLWLSRGRGPAKGFATAFLDRRHHAIRHQPEPGGPVFERKAGYDELQQVWIDEDGYMWITEKEAANG